MHWTTLWIRKAAQRHLSLSDCSTTARRSHRIAGVVVAPVMLANLLGIQSWICTPVRLILRYSVRDLQFHVLRNPVRPRGGGPHCSVKDHVFVILFSGPSTGVGPTVRLGPCLRNPVQRPFPGFHLFSWSVLSCRPVLDPRLDHQRITDIVGRRHRPRVV